MLTTRTGQEDSCPASVSLTHIISNLLLVQVAYEAGVQVTLDCGGIEGPVTPELLHSVSIISPNETELARLTGALLTPALFKPVLVFTPSDAVTWLR